MKMIINDPTKTEEDIIREYYERKRQEKAAGNSGNGGANPPDASKVTRL